MDVNKIIKARRLELGLTLKDVANALGVAEATVSRYETCDIKNMGIDKIGALAKVLQCEPGYLLGWQDAEASEENAESLALLMKDAKLLSYVKSIQEMPAKKKEALYSYIDFLNSTK
jgi:transcriptional regulator with XRE-family HTH domain